MMKAIVYMDGANACLVMPTQEGLEKLGLDVIIEKDVPFLRVFVGDGTFWTETDEDDEDFGKEFENGEWEHYRADYRVVDAAEVPEGDAELNAWAKGLFE